MLRMDRAKWDRVKELVAAAMKLNPADRRRFALEETEDDEEVRAEVQSLLVDSRNKAFIQEGVAALRMPSLEGRTLAQYRIIERLGGGGMGVVYKAQDNQVGRLVALKFLPRDLVLNDQAKKRFVREAQAAAMIDHPNVARVYQVLEHSGHLFIVMEYVEGPTLREVLREHGRIPVHDAVDLVVQIAEGLQAAHEKGIIHRDVKSENLVVGPQNRIKILDFGIAKVSDLSTITDVNTTLGTVAYLSPEQALGRKVDERTDIWSLGVVLYELISGRLPFRGDKEFDVIHSILNSPHAPLDDRDIGIAGGLRKILDKTLAKNARDRYETIERLLDDLSGIAD